MNLRHAAALALVGWYLMVPRPFPDNPLPQWEAPISEWDRYGDFASKARCEAKQAKMIRDTSDQKTCAEILGKAKQNVPGIPDDMLCARIEEYIDISKCVASDDPRFQGQVPPRVDHCCGTSALAKQPQ
jgi:hypothetical protein